MIFTRFATSIYFSRQNFSYRLYSYSWRARILSTKRTTNHVATNTTLPAHTHTLCIITSAENGEYERRNSVCRIWKASCTSISITFSTVLYIMHAWRSRPSQMNNNWLLRQFFLLVLKSRMTGILSASLANTPQSVRTLSPVKYAMRTWLPA